MAIALPRTPSRHQRHPAFVSIVYCYLKALVAIIGQSSDNTAAQWPFL